MRVSARARPLATVPDRVLLRRLRELVDRDRCLEADLLSHMGEVDARELYLEQGCSSMFAYCTEVLRFSESRAYHRIQAARAARSCPLVLDRLRKGEIHLTGVNLVAPHLTAERVIDLKRHLR